MSQPLAIRADVSERTRTACLADLRDHWRRWDFCYGKGSGFSTLPILSDPVWFQGFVYEFSVGRGLQLHQFHTIRNRLTQLPLNDSEAARSGMQAVLGAIRKGITDAPRKVRPDRKSATGKPPDEWTRISLASKLLALWRPQTYPMWDRFARRGLEVLHGHTRGHHYAATDLETYAKFAQDWRELFHLYAPSLAPSLQREEHSRQGFLEKYFDLILMDLGGRN